MKLENINRRDALKWLTYIFIVLFNTYYMPIDGRGGMGPIRFAMFGLAMFLLPFTFRITKALVIGVVYLVIQFMVGFYHPEYLRMSTLIFSVILVFTFISFYNMIHVENILTIDEFINLCKFMMKLYFYVLIAQQVLLIIGIRLFPPLNMTYILGRGFGCYSLSMEPSTFARAMLVFYYCYVKCHEYKRGTGPLSPADLFSKEHRFITCIFLWMMTTMGSGTAFICLILFMLYFIRKTNWFYIIPILAFLYVVVLPLLHFEQLERATAISSAMTTMDQKTVEAADGSGASRISPFLNSLNVDLSDPDVWFGHGIDWGVRHNTFLKQTGTLFDDYGLLFYITALLFDFVCAYRFLSLGCIFMFAGLAGGAGTNIHYVWALMIVMAFCKYFHDNYPRLKAKEEAEKRERERLEAENMQEEFTDSGGQPTSEKVMTNPS
ncbi:MAG: hypothetical protein K6G31_04405 [Paludibacteraceae bacterium]|nr:hypothetical protein [Paludibacteraceae bacterium]